MTRLVACFTKNSTDFHSHSKLSVLLKKSNDFKYIQSIVSEACESWANELVERRDTATHYIALSISSSVFASKTGSDTKKKNITRIGLTKKPLKYVSLWEDVIPTLGGSSSEGSIDSNRKEIHKLLDAKGQIIVLRESPLPDKPELIDGEKYIQTLYENFNQYIFDLLNALVTRL